MSEKVKSKQEVNVPAIARWSDDSSQDEGNQQRKVTNISKQTNTVDMGNYSNVADALQNDLESHRVMYQYLFSENKKKAIPLPNSDNENALQLLPTKSSESRDLKYLSALNTKRNPDIIVPGAKFLKGNMYFKNDPEEKKENKSDKEEGQEVQPEQESDEIMAEDEEFNRMKNQIARYHNLDGNIAIKCRNCMEYGHRARDCPNDTKKLNCILCGKDTHDSFSCTEKICFKCNKVGHVANQCKEKNIIKCNRCQQNGHKEIRCLKIWKGELTNSQVPLIKCIECGKTGHVKCTKESASLKIPIETLVKDDLEEFINNARRQSKANENLDEREARYSFDYVEDVIENSKWIKNNTNILVPEVKSSKKDYRSVYSQALKSYGIPRHHQWKDIYCCYCGSRHKEEFCNYGSSRSGNQKFQQFEKVRNRLNEQTSYERDWGYGNNQYGNNQYSNYNRQNENYAIRLAQDPRVTNQSNNYKNVNKKKKKHDYYEEYDEESDSSSDHKRKHKKKHRKYESSSESSDYRDVKLNSSSSSSSNSSSYSYDSLDSDKILTSFNKLVKKNNKLLNEQSKYDNDEDYQGRSHRTVTQNDNNRSRSRDYNKKQKDHHHSKKSKSKNGNKKHHHNGKKSKSSKHSRR